MPDDAIEERLLSAAQDDARANQVTEGPQIRLLKCFECKTLEVFPDFVGHPEDDVYRQYVDEKHGGSTQQPHTRAELRVAVKHWEDPKIKKALVKRIWEGTVGFSPEYYDVKNTLQADAIQCFNQHRRQDPCIDWHDSSKKLVAPTANARANLARDLPRGVNVNRERLAHGAPTAYLCDYCPVARSVELAKQKARGEA